MNAAIIERLAHGTPWLRIATNDVMYLFALAIGFTLFVRGRFVVISDAAALTLDRTTPAGLDLVAAAIGVVLFAIVVMLGHGLFESFSRRGALIAVWCGLLGCGMQLAASIVHFVPRSLRATDVEPFRSMALAFLKLNARAFDAGLIFFGVYGLVIGFLIVRSALLPRTIGVLMAIGGLAYVASSVATIVSAPLSTYVLAVPALGEGAWIVWLLTVSRRA